MHFEKVLLHEAMSDLTMRRERKDKKKKSREKSKKKEIWGELERRKVLTLIVVYYISTFIEVCTNIAIY